MRRGSRLLAAAAAAAARRNAAAEAAATKRPLAFVAGFTQQFGVMSSVLSGAAVFGGIVAAVGYHNDSKVAALTAKLDSIKAELSEKIGGVKVEMGEKMGGLEGKLGEKMDGMVMNARSQAKVAALEVMKDYGVSVAGGVAIKS